MSKSIELRAVSFCIALFLLPHLAYGSPILIGASVSASLQPLTSSSAVLTQFLSPQVVVDPGTEFTGALFTPNAGGFPDPIQQINSLAMDIDVFSSGFRVTVREVPGSITGFDHLSVPVLRVNLIDLNFSDGSAVAGVLQTGGPPVTSAFVSSPSSISIDFSAFGAPGPALPNIYDFEITAVPEPGTLVLLGAGIVGVFRYRGRPRN